MQLLEYLDGIDNLLDLVCSFTESAEELEILRIEDIEIKIVKQSNLIKVAIKNLRKQVNQLELASFDNSWIEESECKRESRVKLFVTTVFKFFELLKQYLCNFEEIECLIVELGRQKDYDSIFDFDLVSSKEQVLGLRCEMQDTLLDILGVLSLDLDRMLCKLRDNE